ILGETPLTNNQAANLRKFVNDGGKLIAMRPDARLADLLGLEPSGAPIPDGYLQINNQTAVGAGLVNASIQYHGAADLYSLDGATALANLHSPADVPIQNPAVTMRNVGKNGGQAAAFVFDLARSVIYIRQGNPAWSGHHRDGQGVTRTDDQLLGPAKPAWTDLNKITIPQADEQQGLLANMI